MGRAFVVVQHFLRRPHAEVARRHHNHLGTVAAVLECLGGLGRRRDWGRGPNRSLSRSRSRLRGKALPRGKYRNAKNNNSADHDAAPSRCLLDCRVRGAAQSNTLKTLQASRWPAARGKGRADPQNTAPESAGKPPSAPPLTHQRTSGLQRGPVTIVAGSAPLFH